MLPKQISVLRLDTDWYESTRKELEVLYPRLSIGGVLIIDDYGHWAGCKKATDEYFDRHAVARSFSTLTIAGGPRSRSVKPRSLAGTRNTVIVDAARPKAVGA
jgi:hypothetical protein